MIDTYTFNFDMPLEIDFDELVDNVLEEIDSYIGETFADNFCLSLQANDSVNYDEVIQEITKKVAKKLLERC